MSYVSLGCLQSANKCVNSSCTDRADRPRLTVQLVANVFDQVVKTIQNIVIDLNRALSSRGLCLPQVCDYRLRYSRVLLSLIVDVCEQKFEQTFSTELIKRPKERAHCIISALVHVR